MKSTLLLLSIFLCIRLAHAQDSSLNEKSVLVDEDGTPLQSNNAITRILYKVFDKWKV